MQSPFTEAACDEQREVVITADSAGLVKTWQGETGRELASFSTSSLRCTLLQYNVNGGWFLAVSSPQRSRSKNRKSGWRFSFEKIFQVGTSQGSVRTLAGSNLTERSSVKVCDTFKVNTLLVSPDRKYIIAGTKDNDDLSPKVFFVFFDCLIFFFFLLRFLLCYVLASYFSLTQRRKGFFANGRNQTYCTTVVCTAWEIVVFFVEFSVVSLIPGCSGM